jgi:tetratricopeptide (TPR) repeat protein
LSHFERNKQAVNDIKQIFFLTAFLIWNVGCFAQSLQRDRLMRILPALRDSARVDCLNNLSSYYSLFYSFQKNYANRDSIIRFSSPAYDEAVKLNYTHGIAESLLNKAAAEDVADHFAAVELFSRRAISWYRKTLNKKGLATACEHLGYALYGQGIYNQALRYLDTAYGYYKKEGDTVGMYWSISRIALIYQDNGNIEKFLEMERNCLDLAKQKRDDAFCRIQLLRIAELYSEVDDNSTASEYYRQAYSHLDKITGYKIIGSCAFKFGAEFQIKLKQYDSAKYYYKFMDTSEPRARRFYLASSGRLFYAQGQYEKALTNFQRALQYNRDVNDQNQIMILLDGIGRTYLATGQMDSAYRYARESLTMAEQTGMAESEKEAFQIISSFYEQRHRYDSALFYFRKYTLLKEGSLTKELNKKLGTYKYEQQFAVLNNEKEIQRVKLHNEVVLKEILVGSISILLVLALIIFRNITLKRKNESNLRELAENELQIQKLEGEKTITEMEQRAIELEMQALRAQMNPHFIFNSLNSIHRFILENNQAQASQFLTKFSRLIRLILLNSQTSFITLESELESLSLYLELESLRFNYYFSYKISVRPEIDVSELNIPPLIIQPYVENAIWHGLMHKKEKGHLDIDILEENECLLIRISDNGVGRKKAAEKAGKSATLHKSSGIRITSERISRLKNSDVKEPKVTIHDLVYNDGTAAGTEVIIKIPNTYD